MRTIGILSLFLASCGSDPGRVTVAITRDGFVKVEGKAVTLDELAALLAARRDAGRLGDSPGCARASVPPVLLDIEDDAAWGHVNWAMTVLAEQKLWRLTLPGGRDAPLPVDCAVCGGPPPDGKALLAKPENAAILADPAFKVAGVAQSGDCWVVLLGAEE